jgi:hypothetical protein
VKSAPSIHSTIDSVANASHKEVLTEKVLHQRPIRRPRLRVPESNYRRRELTQAELLRGGGELVVRIVSAGVDLAGEFAVGELLGGEQAGGPEGLGGGEGRGVVDVVVAVVGVVAAGRGKGQSICSLLLLLFDGDGKRT